jgi:predicted anti-sigma-YlaC factor YlaD
MTSMHEQSGHPNLERYYDTATDRPAVDRHLAECVTCQAWLADIHLRLGHLACIEFVELVTAYLDDALEPQLKARIDDHLQLCEGCRNYRDQVKATIAAIGRTRELPEPAEVPADVRAGLLAAFRLWRAELIEEPGSASSSDRAADGSGQ